MVYCAVTVKYAESVESTSVTVPVPPLGIDTELCMAQLLFPSTFPEFTVMVLEPVFCMVQVTVEPPLALANATLVMEACSELPMNPMVNAPIHAATTTLTATVTAMSMMVAITGLSAFALFLNFLKFKFFFYPLWVTEYYVPIEMLINIMTYYTTL